MKKNQLSPKQIQNILQEMDSQEAPSVVALCQKHSISRQTYYHWRAKYGESATQTDRIRQLELETRELRNMLIKQRFQIEMLSSGGFAAAQAAR